MLRSEKLLLWNDLNTEKEQVTNLIKRTIEQCGWCPELEDLNYYNFQPQPYEKEEDLYYSCSILNI